MGPYVVVAVGMKIIVYEFKSDQLIGCAFYDAQVYIVSMNVIKNYILFGDVYKSVHFLRWKEKQRTLQLLAKDYEPLAITSTEFNIFDQQLSLLASDMEENIHVMQYLPQDIESHGGQRLVRTGEFHLGVQITSMIRKQVNVPFYHICYVNLLGSSEGSISALIPIHERVFRRLFTLQNVLINTLKQNCGLNPRSYRMMQTTSGWKRTGRRNGWPSSKKRFLDGLVLFRYLHLDYLGQKEIARWMGTTPDVMIQNLLEIQQTTAWFL